MERSFTYSILSDRHSINARPEEEPLLEGEHKDSETLTIPPITHLNRTGSTSSGNNRSNLPAESRDRRGLFAGERSAHQQQIDGQAKAKLEAHLAEVNRVIGSAYSEGDCFFDALAIEFENLGVNIPTDEKNKDASGYKKLRLLCHKIATEQNCQEQPETNWIKKAIEQDGANYNVYLATIQYSAPEMEALKAEKNLFSGIAIWGRANIEGRMLCKALGVRLHVIEIMFVNGQVVQLSHQLTDGKSSTSIIEEDVHKTYSDNKTAHIILYQGSLHFVPTTQLKSYPPASLESPHLLGENSDHEDTSVIIRNDNNKVVQKDILISKALQPFFAWLYKGPFELEKQSCWPNLAISIGVTIGGLGVASMYPLGGSFGNVVSDYFGINDPSARTAVYSFFGTSALTPMLCLSCIEAKDLFKKLSSPNTNIDITKDDHKKLRKGLVFLCYVLAAFSALSPMYATIIAFKSSARWLIYLTVPSSFIGPLIFKSASELRLLDRALNIFSKEENAEIKQMRENIKNNLSKVIDTFKKLSDFEIDNLFYAVFVDRKNLIPTTEYLNEAAKRLQKLMSVSSQKEDKVERIAPPTKHSRGSLFFQGVGFALGAASSYVYYTLADSAVSYLCDYFNITDEHTRQKLRTVSASLSVIPWAALGAEATQAVFGKMYNFFSCKQRGNPIASNKCIPTISVFGGACAATPPTYLAIQALSGSPWYSQLLIIPAFLGPAAIRTVAVSRQLHEGTEYLQKFGTISVATKREQLTTAVSRISAAMDKLPDEILIELYKELLRTQPALFNKNRIQPDILIGRAHGQPPTAHNSDFVDERLNAPERRFSLSAK